jgi:hypothetical protein
MDGWMDGWMDGHSEINAPEKSSVISSKLYYYLETMELAPLVRVV